MKVAVPAATRSSLDAASWLYLRFSGIVLLLLVLGHMFLMHLLVGVNRIDFQFVAARWSGLGWRVYDLTMLLLAMTHGALGLRGLAYEHIPSSSRHAFVAAGYVWCGLITALGAWVILTFSRPL